MNCKFKFFFNLSSVFFLLNRYVVAPFFLRKHTKQTLMTVLLPVLGVSVGVFSFVVVLSVMGGFVSQLKAKLLILEPHIVIQKSSSNHKPTDPLIKEQMSLLTESFPEIKSQFLFKKGDTIIQYKQKAFIASLQGVDVNSATTSESEFSQIVHEGRLDDLKDKKVILSEALDTTSNETKDTDSRKEHVEIALPTVFIGRDLAFILGIHIGERINLVSTLPEEGPLGLAPLQFPVVVAGIINSGHFAHDKKMILTSLPVADEFLSSGFPTEGIHIKLTDPMQAEDFLKKWDSFRNKHLFFINWTAKSWMESNKALLKALSLEHWGMSFVIVVIIFVGCFSIGITLLLTVRRKTREMAILRSLGFRVKDLGLLFILHGSMIGAVGIILGLLSGLLVLEYIQNYSLPFISRSYHKQTLPVVINTFEIVCVCFGGLIMSVVAALWPAIEVMRLSVIKILSRHY